MQRRAHLVGSFPAEDARAAMHQLLEAVGDRLPVLPDGETGERHHWIIHIIEGLRRHPDLEVEQDGRWADYDDRLVFKVRRGHVLTGESLDFGHVTAFRASYPIYQQVRGPAQTGFQGRPVAGSADARPTPPPAPCGASANSPPEPANPPPQHAQHPPIPARQRRGDRPVEDRPGTRHTR